MVSEVERLQKPHQDIVYLERSERLNMGTGMDEPQE